MIEDYRALRAAGRSPQLIIGPWTHTSSGLAGVSLREAIAWMRAHLLGDVRMLSPARVRVYVTGERRWRELREWPPPAAREHKLYLHAGGHLSSSPPETASPPTRYRYDPAAPTPALGGAMLLEQRPVRDNRPLEARPDVVTFTGAPLGHDTDVLGPVHADIHIRSSRGNTDVFVRVCDVQPYGASCRAPARCGRRRARALRPVADGPPLRPWVTASASRSRAERTRATRAIPARAKIHSARPTLYPPNRRSSTIPSIPHQ